MSSPGQILGGIVGAVVGFYVPGGNILLGASIGMAIGGAIDPPKGPHIEGPRINDKRVQVSSYGETIPYVAGTVALHGNVFWVENNSLKETAVKEESGGKGGGGQEVTTYSYYATFAVALCEGPIESVRRIWIGNNLVFDAGNSDIYAGFANNEYTDNLVGFFHGFAQGATTGFSSSKIGFYLGTDDQLPDPRMEATLGVGNVPAYRGICYIVFYDLPLADYGNSLLGAQVKVEVLTSGSITSRTLISEKDWPKPPGGSSWAFGGLEDPLIDIVPTDKPQPAPDDYVTYYNGIVESAQTAHPDLEYPKIQSATHDTGTLYGTYNPYFFYGPNKYLDSDSIARPINCWALQEKEGILFGFGRDGTGAGLNFITTISLVDGTPYGTVTSTSHVYANYNYDFCVCGDVLGFANLSDNSRAEFTFFNNQLQQIEQYIFPGGNRPLWNPSSGVGDNWYFKECAWRIGDFVYVATNTLQGNPEISIYNLTNLTITRQTLLSAGYYQINGPHYLRAYPGGIFKFAGVSAKTNIGQSSYIYSGTNLTPNGVTLSSIVSALCAKSKLSPSDIDVSSLQNDIVRGYTVSSAGNLRSAIEPLQAAWPFDVVPSGYTIIFKRRPVASVLTIPEVDLGAIVHNSENVPRLIEMREMDSQLPKRIDIRYIDVNREYDTSEQYEERLNTTSINQRILDLPIVLSATEAANIAQQTVFRGWVERVSYSFVLPPKEEYLKLQPADVITIVTSTGTHEILIQELNLLPNGIIDCMGIRNSSAIYNTTAIGVDGSAPENVLEGTFKTLGVILDIPQVHQDQGSPGIISAMRSQGTWEGASLMLTRDSGATWTTNAALSIGQESIIGTCLTALEPAKTFAMLDTYGTLSISLNSGSLFSITRSKLLNGGNTFAIGAHGRWEIIQAQTCIETSTGYYTLSNFLRGRYGTEHLSSTHTIGDSIVLLDENKIALGYLKNTDFDVSYQWRFVTKNKDVTSATGTSLAYTGNNLECLSPVKAKSHKLSNGDLVLTWKRRTRFNGGWANRVDAPLNETFEKYDVVIYTNSTRLTVKRTYSNLTSATCTYSLADQITDFGGSSYYVNARIYQLSELRGRGQGLDCIISAPEHDLHWANVSYLCHCDGSNGSNVLKDEKGHIFTPGALLLSTSDYKFGSASIGSVSPYYPGFEVVPDTTTNFGTNIFTIEAWVKHSGANSKYVTVCYQGTTNGDYDFYLTILGNGSAVELNWGSNNTSNNISTLISGVTFAANVWTHVAVSRVGDNLLFFANGTLLATRAMGTSWNIRHNGPVFRIGAGNTTYRTEVGNLDEVRITKGVARYTATFTPPISPFPHD